MKILFKHLTIPFYDDIEFTTSTFSTNYVLYKNAVVGRELLSSIFTIIEENVISEVKKSLCWSLLVDESNTNIIFEKTIALVSKHLVNEEPIFRFLGLTQ
ncbi:23166_t:CDS:1, partial [Gigaspora rosea]